MAVTPTTFVKIGQMYLNAGQIIQVVTQGDGTALLYYTGGHLMLHLGANEAAAITALNAALGPVDVTTYL